MDRVVLDLVQSQTFEASDFPITRTGVCRLNPQMAKRMVSTIAQVLDQRSSGRQLGNQSALININGL